MSGGSTPLAERDPRSLTFEIRTFSMVALEVEVSEQSSGSPHLAKVLRVAFGNDLTTGRTEKVAGQKISSIIRFQYQGGM